MAVVNGLQNSSSRNTGNGGRARGAAGSAGGELGEVDIAVTLSAQYLGT